MFIQSIFLKYIWSVFALFTLSGAVHHDHEADALDHFEEDEAEHEVEKVPREHSEGTECSQEVQDTDGVRGAKGPVCGQVLTYKCFLYTSKGLAIIFLTLLSFASSTLSSCFGSRS